MIFFLGNFIYTYFFVVRNKHYYPGTIGSFFGGMQGVEGEGSFCTMFFASSILNRSFVLFCFSSLQTSSVMYITGQGVVLGDNAIGRGRGGGGCVPVAFPVLQTGGVVKFLVVTPRLLLCLPKIPRILISYLSPWRCLLCLPKALSRKPASLRPMMVTPNLVPWILISYSSLWR